jgi:RNA polymerase sigma-54 factor
MDLSLHLSQKQILSQKMQLSARILQMTSLDLSEYLQQLATENPVLEWEEVTELSSNKELEDMRKRLQWLKDADEKSRRQYQQEHKDVGDEWNFALSEGESLTDYLLAQINLLVITQTQYVALRYLAQCISPSGYLQDSMVNEMANKFSLTEDDTQEVLKLLHSLDPAGIGARNLRECLLLQLDKKKNKSFLCEEIIKHYLEQLGKNQLQIIARKLKVTVDEVIDAKKIIQSLNPKPGSGFASDHYTEYVIADIAVYWQDGKLQVTVRKDGMGKFKINPYYEDILSNLSETEAGEYIATKIRQAQWVMQCVEKRNTTVLRTAEAIVAWQRTFFTQPDGALKPMRLLDIAQQLQLHESTVSRAIKGKYLQCSRGVFPLHYFFTTGIATQMPTKTQAETQTQISSQTVKEKISRIIETEDKNAPYSDRKITELLNEMGIEISRRTVAKYREAMGIAGASGRKIFL